MYNKSKKGKVSLHIYIYIAAMAENEALKKYNTHYEKYQGSAPMGIAAMQDDVLKKHYSQAQ